VFLGLVPVVVLAGRLVVPSVRQLNRPDPGRSAILPAQPGARRARGLRTELSWASQHPSGTAAVTGGALALLGPPTVALPVLLAVLAGLGVLGAAVADRAATMG
jgi:hypothetical protein